MSNRIILGTVQFGMDYGINNTMGKLSKQKITEILEYAAYKRIKEIDTADAYGRATDLLGNFNESHPELFSYNTKFRLCKVPIAEQLERTLSQLKINLVNTYFYHSFSDLASFPDTLLSLASLKRSNQIMKIGVSVYENIEFKKSIEFNEIDVIQIPFNLLDNIIQRGDLIKLAKAKGKEIQARSVFMQGLFFMPIQNIPEKLALLKPSIEKIHQLSIKHQIEIEKLALLYVLEQEGIDKIIIGVDNLEQLRKNLEFKRTKLPKEIIDCINQITIKGTELLYPKNWD